MGHLVGVGEPGIEAGTGGLAEPLEVGLPLVEDLRVVKGAEGPAETAAGQAVEAVGLRFGDTVPVDEQRNHLAAGHGEELHGLAAGADGGEQRLFVIGEEQEQDGGRGFLQRFQEGVGGVKGHRAGAVDDDDGAGAFERVEVDGAFQLPDGTDGDGGDGAAVLHLAAELNVDDANVGVQAVGDALALGAPAAGGAGTLQAVDGLGDLEGECHLAHLGRPLSR